VCPPPPRLAGWPHVLWLYACASLVQLSHNRPDGLNGLYLSLLHAKQPEAVLLQLLRDCPPVSPVGHEAGPVSALPPASAVPPALVAAGGGLGVSGSIGAGGAGGNSTGGSGGGSGGGAGTGAAGGSNAVSRRALQPVVDADAGSFIHLSDKQCQVVGVVARYYPVAVGRCATLLGPVMQSWVEDLPHLALGPCTEDHAFRLVAGVCDTLSGPSTPTASAVIEAVVGTLEVFSRSEGVRGWLDEAVGRPTNMPRAAGALPAPAGVVGLVGVVRALGECPRLGMLTPAARGRVEAVCVSLLTHVVEPGGSGPDVGPSTARTLGALKAALLSTLRQLIRSGSGHSSAFRSHISTFPAPGAGPAAAGTQAPAGPSLAPSVGGTPVVSPHTLALVDHELVFGSHGSREAALQLLLAIDDAHGGGSSGGAGHGHALTVRPRIVKVVLKELPVLCLELSPDLRLLAAFADALVACVVDGVEPGDAHAHTASQATSGPHRDADGGAGLLAHSTTSMLPPLSVTCHDIDRWRLALH
jgi:hypothetical protein